MYISSWSIMHYQYYVIMLMHGCSHFKKEYNLLTEYDLISDLKAGLDKYASQLTKLQLLKQGKGLQKRTDEERLCMIF